ncbi:MAG: sulfatase-like hydrolase/transferase [Lacunisphaera sp.]|nr:sulfatase-like hydrolase/transferase [Lacunisphaera sp.]
MKTAIPFHLIRNTHALSCLLALWCSTASIRAASSEPTRPNILFLLTDDQTWEALGCTGGEVKTPNMDGLAARGMLFTHGYNMGSWTGAVCVASRTMFNTGRTLWHCRDLELAELAYRASRKDGNSPLAKPNPGTAWSQWLRSAGYRTYFAGKWHTIVHDVHDLFDIVGTVRPGMADDTPDGYNRPDAAGIRTWLPWDQSKGGHWEGGRHWEEILADEGIGFLKIAAQRKEPFFMYLAFNSPHDPRQSPRDYVEMYPIDQVKVPRNFLPDYPYRLNIGLPDSQRDERLAPHPRTEFAIKVHRQEYYALVTFLDAQIGRILDALEKNGLAGNTIVFSPRTTACPWVTTVCWVSKTCMMTAYAHRSSLPAPASLPGGAPILASTSRTSSPRRLPWPAPPFRPTWNFPACYLCCTASRSTVAPESTAPISVSSVPWSKATGS